MNKEFITYNQAIALKELGFDEPCFLGYKKEDFFELFTKGLVYNSIYETFNGTTNLSCTAPLYQQAFRWFREKHDKYGVVNIDLSNNLKDKIFVYMVEDKLGYIIDRSEEYNTYEEAEQACLDKLIEIVKNNAHI
jgi:hypothetical protein